MKIEELIDHINGSILKQQYLEAFLVQSAYIESILKTYFDFNYFTTFSDKGKPRVSKIFPSKLFEAIRKKSDKMSLQEIINLLHSSELIDIEIKRKLELYKLKRNNVIHHLTKEIANNNFESELKEICELGQEIINTKKFEIIVNYIHKGKQIE